MAMTISPATLAKSLIRGEAISYDFGLNDPDGNPEVLKDRIIALAIYQGEEMLGFHEGTYVPAAEGGRDLVRFMLTGAEARELFGKRPSYDLLEVLDDGSDTLAQGTINILPGSPRIVDLDSAPMARTRLRVIRTAPKLVTDAATFTVEIVRTSVTASPVTPPASDNLLDFSSAAGSQYIGLF